MRETIGLAMEKSWLPRQEVPDRPTLLRFPDDPLRRVTPASSVRIGSAPHQICTTGFGSEGMDYSAVIIGS